MKIRKKHLVLALALTLGLGGLQACQQNNNTTNPASGETMPMSTESSEEVSSSQGSDEVVDTAVEKEYDQMTKDEKISYLEDKIFNIRVKARSLEMKLEENPQYSDEEKENIQNSIDQADSLIEAINKEIDKLENK